MKNIITTFLLLIFPVTIVSDCYFLCSCDNVQINSEQDSDCCTDCCSIEEESSHDENFDHKGLLINLTFNDDYNNDNSHKSCFPCAYSNILLQNYRIVNRSLTRQIVKFNTVNIAISRVYEFHPLSRINILKTENNLYTYSSYYPVTTVLLI